MTKEKARTSGKRGTGLKHQINKVDSHTVQVASQAAFASYEAAKKEIADAGLSPREYEAAMRRIAKSKGL